MIKQTLKTLILTIFITIVFTACSKDDCTEQTWYLDADADGFGDPNTTQAGCNPPQGYVSDNTDLNDNNRFVTNTNIWTGADITFTKAANVDWTLPANQDKITDKVVFTRQNNRPLYNYQWWQDNFGQDVTSDDLDADFWNNTTILGFTPSGGTKGVKWAILDDTGATTDWSGFAFYGTLGDPTHFYSFAGIASAIADLENGNTVSAIPQFAYGTQMKLLEGKKLACWIEDEDIYFTLTFTDWGKGNGSGSGGGGSIAYTRSTLP